MSFDKTRALEPERASDKKLSTAPPIDKTSKISSSSKLRKHNLVVPGAALVVAAFVDVVRVLVFEVVVEITTTVVEACWVVLGDSVVVLTVELGARLVVKITAVEDVLGIVEVVGTAADDERIVEEVVAATELEGAEAEAEADTTAGDSEAPEEETTGAAEERGTTEEVLREYGGTDDETSG